VAVALRVFIDHLPDDAWDDGRREESFALLFARCRPELIALCRRHLGPTGDAEAIAQEAFLKAWSSLDRYSTARPFWPWLATIARRLCIDHLRRRQRELRYLNRELQGREARPDEPEVVSESEEERRTAVLAFKRLRPREQRLIGLREVDGWSIEQLARFEGISLDATRTALKRARAALRQSYEQVISGVPVVFVFGLLARARARITRAAGRVLPGDAALLSRGGELLLAALVLSSGQGMVDGRPAGASSAAPTTFDRPSLASSVVGTPMHPSDGGAASTASVAPPDGSPPMMAGAVPTVRDAGPSDFPLAMPVALDHASQPEDATITSFTASPHYEHDGTVFAAGYTGGCTSSCPVLFVSHDRGATWTRLAAVGYKSGPILLPPDYPTDHRLFVAGLSGLVASNDGGQSFLPLGLTPPASGNAAISPGFDGIDPRIVVGGTPGWTYDDGRQQARPSDALVPSTSETTPRFAADVPDGSLMLFAGATATPMSHKSSAIFRCDRTTCSAGTPLPGLYGAPSLTLSPAFGRTGEALAWSGTLLYRTVDGGLTFTRVAPPKSGTIRELVFDDAGALYAGAITSTEGPGGVFRSVDGGTTWTTLATSGIEAMVVLPDGRLLAQNEGRGLSCSSDRGTTWEPRCS
jgi:RNA polymerase sigma-70 factor (ECF subfamily)